MSHRVANFFRVSTSSLDSQASKKKTSVGNTRRRDSPAGQVHGRRLGSSERVVSYASSTEDDADDYYTGLIPSRIRMGESRSASFSSDSHKEHHAHHHRISFPGIHFGRSSKESHSNALVALDWKLESPPVVMYGDPEHSTGALVSGQLFLTAKEEGLEIDSFEATLNIHVVQKKPFVNHCNDCTHQYTELRKWRLIENPLTLTKGNHPPFSQRAKR